jgi:HEAT repeat protein
MDLSSSMNSDQTSGDKVSQLIDQLASFEWRARANAAIALGNTKDSQVVPALIELLERDDVSGAGQSAAWALGEIGDRRAVEPLLAATRKRGLTSAAITALVKLRDERALAPIIDIFQKTNQADLATVLGNWGDTRAVEPLIAAMRNPDAHIRYYTARALGRIGDERAVPVLEWAAANDRVPILDTKSLRRKSVSYAATRALEAITSRSK